MCELLVKPVPDNPFTPRQMGWINAEKPLEAMRKANRKLVAAPMTYCQIPLLKGQTDRRCKDTNCKRLGCMERGM